MHTVPFHIFKDEIAKALISAALYDAEWFKGQNARIALMHDMGEPLDIAIESIKLFARHQLNSPSTISPKALAGKYGAYTKC